MPAQRRLLSKALALILAASACRLASRGGAGSAFAPSAATLAAHARAVADRPDAERDADARVLEDVLRGAEAAAASSAFRGGAGSAFAPSAATLAAPARAVADRADAERDADARVLEDVLRGAEAAAASVLEPWLQSGGEFVEAVPGTVLNPPWATCYVEAQLTTRSVIEEWVMRGEREVTASFSAWRRSSEKATSIKCVDTPTEDALQSECLECALTFDVSAEGVLTFSTGSSQCMESAARGQGFCKSGQLWLG